MSLDLLGMHGTGNIANTMTHALRGRRLTSLPEIGQEELGWMAIGFSLAIICLGLGWMLLRLAQFCCDRRRRVPHKITAAPDLPVGETRSESEEASSRLATFLQNQRPAPDATSDVSQSDVWSFSLKSFSPDPNAYVPPEDHDDEEDENRSDLDDSTFDASLYTTNTGLEPARVPPPMNVPVEKAAVSRFSRRFGAPVEI